MKPKVFLKNLKDRLRGLPPVTRSSVTKELIRHYVGKDDPTILELGCNDGMHTLWFLDIFNNPKIYCFEPDPRALERFKKNVGQHPNVTLFNQAIGDFNGEIDFYQSGGHANEKQLKNLPDGWDYSGSIRPPKNHLKKYPWVTFENKITVPITTLDTWRKEHAVEEIDFIWMDVQGAEIDVFRGAREALTKTRFIYTEYSNRELYEGQYSLRKLLRYLGNYQPVIRYPQDVLLRNRKML